MYNTGYPGEVSGRNEEHVIGQWKNIILAILWQRTWLNFVHILVLCRKYSLQNMKFDIW